MFSTEHPLCLTCCCLLQRSTSVPGGAGRGAGSVQRRRTGAGTPTARYGQGGRRRRWDLSHVWGSLSAVRVFPGQVLRSVSAEFETDASTQNHLPGRSGAARERQTSQTEPQTGAGRVTGTRTHTHTPAHEAGFPAACQHTPG